MMIALYVGDHADDTPWVRLCGRLIRLAQKGPLGDVTHVEAVLSQHADGAVCIASASARDGGVRIKDGVQLTPGHWRLVDVPAWSAMRAAEWFQQRTGLAYDWRGAMATVLPGRDNSNRWFCSEAVGASVGLVAPHTFGPHQLAAVALSLGREVTDLFFAREAFDPT